MFASQTLREQIREHETTSEREAAEVESLVVELERQALDASDRLDQLRLELAAAQHSTDEYRRQLVVCEDAVRNGVSRDVAAHIDAFRLSVKEMVLAVAQQDVLAERLSQHHAQVRANALTHRATFNAWREQRARERSTLQMRLREAVAEERKLVRYEELRRARSDRETAALDAWIEELPTYVGAAAPARACEWCDRELPPERRRFCTRRCYTLSLEHYGTSNLPKHRAEESSRSVSPRE